MPCNASISVRLDIGPPRQQHDGSLRRFQPLPFGFADFDPGCQRRDIGRHDREGLGVALLALAQASHGGDVLGIANEMKPAEPLKRQNVTGEEAFQRGGDYIVHGNRRTVGVAQSQARTADCAGVRLGVKAAFGGGAVFPRAIRAGIPARNPGIARNWPCWCWRGRRAGWR